jgi:hypothetical protein
MRINEFLQQMLSFSNQSVYSVAPVAQTKNVTVNQMLDEIAPRTEAELADQPEVRAQILRTIASAYASQGIYDKAEKISFRARNANRIFGTTTRKPPPPLTQFGVLALRQEKSPKPINCWKTPSLFTAANRRAKLPISER